MNAIAKQSSILGRSNYKTEFTLRVPTCHHPLSIKVQFTFPQLSLQEMLAIASMIIYQTSIDLSRV